MPITLYHGPAGPEKIRRLWDLSAKNPNTLVITARPAFVTKLKSENPNAFVLSFSEFLQTLLRRSTPPEDEVSDELILDVLAALRRKEIVWPEKARHVCISRMYPLYAGEREVLRRLQDAFPHVVFAIFYDEDYARADGALLDTYTDLGDMSAENEFIAKNECTSLSVVTCPTPVAEMIFVANAVNALLAAGTNANDIAVVAPNTAVLPLTSLIVNSDIVIADVATVAASLAKHVFILSAVAETFVPLAQNSKTEFTDPLKLPQARYKIALERLRHLVLSVEHPIITETLLDFANRPVTKISWDGIAVTHEVFIEEQKKQNLNAPKFFAPVKKENFSISEIQKYVDCPYQYYATYVLKLSRDKKSALELDAAARGNFAHLVLKKLIDNHRDTYVSVLKNKDDLQKISPLLKNVISQQSATFPEFKNLPQIVVTTYTERLGEAILITLAVEANLHGEGKKTTLPHLTEHDVAQIFSDITLSNITVSGRIDRIDMSENRDAITIIDYKTGSPPTLTDVRCGVSLQLPFYLMAAETAFPTANVAAALYYNLKEAKIQGFTLANSADTGSARAPFALQEWEELKNKVTNAVTTSVTGITNGTFLPNPRDEDLCKVCDFKMICNYKSQNAEKVKDDA